MTPLVRLAAPVLVALLATSSPLAAAVDRAVGAAGSGQIGPSLSDSEAAGPGSASASADDVPLAVEIALVQSEDGPLGISRLVGRAKADLVAEITRRLRDLGGPSGIDAGQPAFELWLVVGQLLDEHPKSREALLLRRDRFFGLRLAALDEAAGRWSAANPDLVATYRVDPALTQASQPGSGSEGLALPGIAGLVPARPTDGTAPAKLSIPSWFKSPNPGPPPADGIDVAAAQVVPPPEALPGVSPVLSRRDLFERLKETTVLVVQLGQQPNGQLVWFGHGTGSFISPTRVLTNTHVVEAEKGVVGHSFLVISKSLGISRATVLARGQSAGGTGVDAAILDVLDMRNPVFLPFTRHFSEGAPVVLSGFAGKANALDRAFSDVKDMVNSGVLPTAEHIPNPKFSSGSIQAVFIDTTGEETVAADIEATNGASGSPIVNSCGEIVALLYAVSTSRVDKDGYVDASMYNYSASAREVTKWLDSARVPYTTAATECERHD